ncbi:Maf family protein [Aeromonas simiae]|uniref:dTTP/UTP pyrophosphatase n=1 Tax=Aeromonas simiae TaxID=218936 RepID=A0A5J6WXJ0_9GAMM|nr:Maf family protein [Aeromonas simiae]MDO2949940.1 Maf-like protein [Aeromonas simiae]MDO2953938.1 Maf-like protein [Aeromonas simiae]MDO2957283.1 Maf-like protein [Aeromonas simiae]QFI55846.1 septum formation inhibitor Maf [Aeromonas simiae]
MANSTQLYLASASPRRRELLTQLGYRFEVLKLEVPEQRQSGEKPQDYVCRLARDKALAGAAIAPAALPVLGADTIVVLGDRVLEKPSDLLDAKDMLEALSGRVHQVMTAVALASAGRCDVRLVTTNVAFRKLDEAEIEAYWQTGEPCDKAGAYGIQGIAGKFVSRIEGSYSAVVGLPLLETDLLIRSILEQR